MLPWADLLRFAARNLSWSPSDFWSATPRELEAVLGLARATTCLDRPGLEQLMRSHPDRLPDRMGPTTTKEHGNDRP